MEASPTAGLPGLTIVLPTKREAENLPWLFGRLHAELDELVGELEILVVDTPTDDGTEEVCREHGARYLGDPAMGFADALRTGFREARHEVLVTMDADGSHDPRYIRWMLGEIASADLVICSRYVPRGGQEASAFRYLTSRVLNWWLGTLCSLPLQDLSGGFKMYRKAMFAEFELASAGFEIQCEIAAKAYGHGFRLREIPFCYHPRKEGHSKAAIIRYGLAFLFSSLRLRKYRNSIEFCDYDERAYHSRIPMQRVWQQTRYARMMGLLQPHGAALDLGCGSGRLIIAWPSVVGLDVNAKPLRYLANDDRRLVQSEAETLPFPDQTFDCLFCCEVVEHLPQESPVFQEIARVLKPGGKALLTTPNYGSMVWPAIERLYKIFAPSAYGHQHISRYDQPSLSARMADAGLECTATGKMFGAILLALFEKPEA